MWGINIINKEYCDLTGFITRVTVSVDNGDTQHMTIVEYNNLIDNRKKYGKRKENLSGTDKK